MTESKENDLVPRQVRMWLMGDGTTNSALKGSPRGRRQGPLAFPGTPAHHRGRGNAAAVWPVWQCAHQGPLFQPPPGSPRSWGGPGWVSSVGPVFSQRRLSSRALLESDSAGATLLPTWQLLPLIPGTSGLKIAVKVTLVCGEKMLKYTFWT